MSRWAVIGVGNRLRRDDGVGLAVVERLEATVPAGVTLVGLEHVPPDLYERWAGARHVFLIDAACSGASPGTVRRLDPGAGPLPTASLRLSTHGFDVAQAIELARTLDRLPAIMEVFAIEGAEFGGGEGLSPEVASAAERVAAQILGALRELSQPSQRKPAAPGGAGSGLVGRSDASSAAL